MAKALDGRGLKRYCRRLQLSQEALEIPAKTRSSPLASRVRTSTGNVPAWHPSVKMGAIIQAESNRIEFARLLELECEVSALE